MALSTGDRLGRYEILEPLGAGGMGEVYRARDIELERDVAVKVLPQRVAGDESRLERFRREAQAVARLAHPNILDIHDFGLEGDITYSVTELLEGETLGERLEDGELGWRAATEIGAAIADGLAAAHKANIVHRDLKPSNVFLTSDGRVKILDFGLAQVEAEPVEGETQAPTVTRHTDPGTVLGTVGYMSPEQVRGESVDHRSDIFSLGCVLYEMVCGKRAFSSDTAVETMTAILREEPVDISSSGVAVPFDLSETIRRCLEKRPESRFQSASDLAYSLRSLVSTSMPSMVPPVRQTVGRKVTPWLAVAALVAAIAALLIVQRGRQPAEPAPIEIAAQRPAPPQTLRRSVAVLGFNNLAGRDEMSWVSTAIAELLGTHLGAGRELRIMPGEAVTQAKIELELPESDSFTAATLGKVRRNLGADVVVIGSYLALGSEGGDKVTLSVRAQDTGSGEIIGLVAEQGDLDDIFLLVGNVASKLARDLGVGEATAGAAMTSRASFPANPEAARLYAEGLDRLRHFDALAAKDALQSAVAAAPDHPMPYLALSEAWGRLGYDVKARDAAAAAFERAEGLGLTVRLTVEARLRELEGEWEQAADLYRTLWAEAPDTIEYGLALAEVELAWDQQEAALATLTALRQLPAPASADPRIDLAEAEAADLAANHELQLEAAARAAEKGAARQAPLMVAEARLHEATARWRLGVYEPAIEAAEAARALWDKAGDRYGASNALTLIANVRMNQGDLEGALERYETVLAIRREIGDRGGEGGSLNNLAIVYLEQGDLPGALERYEQALAIRREIGDRRGEATVLNNMAAVFLQQGNLSAGLERLERALAIHQQTGDRHGQGFTLNSIGAALYYMGDFEGARRRYEEALAIRREIGERRGEAESLANIADVLNQLGNPSGARERFEEALAIHREIGYLQGEALALINLGEVYLAQAEPRRAAVSLEEALQICREIGSKWYESHALFRLAETLTVADRLADAEARHREAQELREELGAAAAVRSSRLARAALALETGRSAGALSGALELVAAYREAGDADGEAAAEAVLARGYLASGMNSEAASAADRAAALVAESQGLLTRFRVMISVMRVRGLTGQPAAVRETLATIANEAADRHLTTLALEGRLALGEVESAARDPAGEARLEAAAIDAEQRGCMLLARKAREALES
jgi:tetratricopeptide (TPR) repeat protein